MPHSKKINNLLLSASAAIIGLAFIISPFLLQKQSLNTDQYLKTTGVIIKSAIKDVSYTNRLGAQLRYAPAVKYSYKEGYRYYESDIFSNLYATYRSEKEIKDILKDYQEGTKVDVFYNKDNPAEAFLLYLKPTMLQFGALFMIGVVILMLGAVGLYFHFIYKR